RLGRPIPPRSATIKLAKQLRPKGAYRIRVRDVRNLAGIVRSTELPLTAPDPLPVPPAPAPARSTAPPAAPPPPPPAPIRR
ncbi:MAG TPA: hypothetical protein VGC52_08380, partial [Gemmatimonadaceae bacterium]